MHEAYSRCNGMDPISKEAYLESLGEAFSFELMKNKFHTIYMPTFGLLLLIGMIVIALFKPFPSAYQLSTFGIGIAFFAGLGAALIPGYFEFRFKGLVRAGGCLGVFAFVYLVQPKTYSTVPQTLQQKITIDLVPKDTTAIQSIQVDFNPNSGDKLCKSVAASLGRYLGDALSDTAYTFYRTSDGMIYSQESCRYLRETDIIVISNFVQSYFTNKRNTYLHFIKSFKP